MTQVRMLGRDVRAGDVLIFLGKAHLLTRIEPYYFGAPPEAGAPEPRIAHAADDDWRITLTPDGWYDVVPGNQA